ncbi:MAG: calcium/sodium antiporter [Planctomycetota bacterium]|nr:calcium/sodium antiporter [Planctomycetota bacterium]MDP6519258.1 calcium/sodium antiporter [Planctomycetota bacterium]MDP6838359.1 calcium/sodium antiporter [Planctomycetota bacterium]
MLPFLVPLVLVIIGFILLTRGADWLVDGGVALAQRWGVSTLVIGLTVLAWGTSLPELLVSALGAAEGHPGIALGNVLGSNVANIGLVMGASALVLAEVLGQPLAGREILWLHLSIALVYLLLLDGVLSRLDGGLLLGAFALHNLHLWKTAQASGAPPAGHRSSHPFGHVCLGAVAIAAGAQCAVWGAADLARLLEIPDRVIGLTLLALGTSLPEVAAGVGAARKGYAEISMGNVVGSNVFNTLAALGVAALIHPIGGDALASGEQADATMAKTLALDLPTVAAFGILLTILPWLIPHSKQVRRGRPRALLLLAAYASYVIFVLVD